MLNHVIFKQAVFHSRDGITIGDNSQKGCPLIFVNKAFEAMTGYKLEELEGKNCNFLQANDIDQEEIQTIRDAMREGRSCLVVLRNYRKDGQLFWNELSLSPVIDNHNNITHYIGIQKDVTEKVQLLQTLQQQNIQLNEYNNELKTLALHDNLTSVYNRHYLDKQLSKHWQSIQRENDQISLFMIDIDKFKQYNDHFGHNQGDLCLQKVAHCFLSKLKRSSDYVVRLGGEEFLIVALGMNENYADSFAKEICNAIRELKIPHPYSNVDRFITVSIGYITVSNDQLMDAKYAINLADAALYQSKTLGRNKAIRAL